MVRMVKRKELSIYVRPEIEDWIRKKAEKEGLSKSGVVARLIDERILADEKGKVLRHVQAESRVKALIGEGKNELVRIAESVEDMLGRIGCYTIANWEFSKRISEELDLNITDTHRRNFLSTGSKRLRKAFEKHLEAEKSRVPIKFRKKGEAENGC